MAQQTIDAADNLNAGRGKLNSNFTEVYTNKLEASALRPTSTALVGTELTFDQYYKKHTKTISANQTLSLAALGNVAESFINIITTGNGTNILSFPVDWVMLGDSYNQFKIQDITLKYDGTYVSGVIVTLDDAPDGVAPTLSSAKINNSPDNALQLTFSEAVNITTVGWSIATTGAALSISSVLSGSGTTTPQFLLSRSILSTEVITVSYDSATGNTLDLSGNEVSSFINTSVSNFIPLLFDDFGDGVISTSNWDVTDPADGVTISETGGVLRFAANPASPVASTNTNTVVSDSSFALGSKLVFRATVLRNSDSVNQAAVMRIHNAVDTYATARQIQISKGTGNVLQLRIYNGTSFTYDFVTTAPWQVVGTAVKVIIESNNDIKFYYWDSSAWIQLGTTQNYDLGGSVKLGLQANSVVSDTGTPNVDFDVVYVTSVDYSTIIP